MPDHRILLELDADLPVERRKSLAPHRFEVPHGTAALVVRLGLSPTGVSDPARARALVADALELQRREALAAGAESVAAPGLDDPNLEGVAAALRNLVNLTLTDPAGRHRGRWDRNSPERGPGEDVLAETWASPGYVAGPIPPGLWTATLEVHEVLEPCRVQIRIGAAQPAPLPVDDPGRAGTALPPRETNGAPPPGWIRGELHCHSTASDGQHAPAELLERARAAGLDFIALTDHNSTAGLAGLPRSGMPVISGCELTTFHGLFLALGLPADEAPPAWYAGDRPLTPQELALEVHRRGALFGLAHPFVLGNPVCCGCRLEAQVPVDQLDLVEVWSRGAQEPIAMHHALRLFDELRRSGRRVVAVAGRDWHGPAQEGPRFPANLVHAPPEATAILSALRRGACYLSVGPLLELTLAAAGRLAGPGQDLALSPEWPPPVAARVRIDRLDREALLRILSGGAALLERRVRGAGLRLEVPGIRPAVGGVRLELWDLDGRPLALSNPIEPFAERGGED